MPLASFVNEEEMFVKSKFLPIGIVLPKCRLLAKEMKTVDREPHLIGRYTQVLFDGPPSMMPEMTSTLKADKNVLKINFFKVKDFYSYAQEYKKPMESLIAQKHPRDETARKIAILQDQGL